MKKCLRCGVKFSGNTWQCPACAYMPEIVDGFLSFAPELARSSTGFKSSHFAELASLETGNFWFRSRNKLILWALKKYFPRARVFLEVGCGTGYVLSGIEKAFPELKLYGSEIYASGLSFCRERVKAATLFQMDALRIPFEDEFDVIGAFDVLEHIGEDTEVLSQMHRSLKDGGGIMLTVPQHPFLWSRTDDYACHVRRYTARELRGKVEGAGFKITKITSFVSFLLPLMAASRFMNRSLTKDFDSASELKQGRVTNFLLEKLLDTERLFIKHGWLPAGGSLFIAANKV